VAPEHAPADGALAVPVTFMLPSINGPDFPNAIAEQSVTVAKAASICAFRIAFSPPYLG